MPGQFHPRGVTMRDYWNGRAGFDRVLMAVAATFLAVSATAAFAQADPARSTPADLAIDAAIPRPEPANVPPPTINDFKIETTATVPDPAKTTEKALETKPAEAAAAPAGDVKKDDTANTTATTPPAAAAELVKAASNVAPADQPVADKLKEMLGAKSSKYFDRKGERAAVEKFYTAREYAPLWTQGGALTASAKGVIARLKDAAADGLNAADYPAPNFTAATSADSLADAELKLTASMLDYARQAQSGRIHWSQVSADIQYPDHPTDPAEVLANITTAKDVGAALEAYNPPHKLYRELKAKLAELRGQGDGPVIQIAEGQPLKYVPARKKQPEVLMEDPRVPQLRAKLGITENADDTRYDAKVAEAVRKFQDGADLKVTGVLDDRTVKAINSPKRDRAIDTVIVNMERWRWLPRQLGAPSLGDAYVILNIPDYTLRVMQNGAAVWTTRVVTGKPGNHATPLLTETMKFITVNPTWNVPPSIIYNEYLPALQQDPTVLSRMGLRLERSRDGSIHISQPPGERNALGRIRFNFPNKFLVYQHDTPDKHLFAKEERAFSHGCMRVQNPDQYAATLLG
ncbi:MAG: L,D-transpeptidase YcbB, partial [Thermoanaerobaculia bacterium]|nr:L,D-transpeptidase YcbB [Thermoanaerobaculia bacterium]